MPRNEWEKDHGNWSNFFHTTNTRLATEVCDYYRSDALVSSMIRENRYYYDVANDIRVSVVLQLGLEVNITLHTAEYLSAQCTTERCVQSGCDVGHCALDEHDTISYYPPLHGEDVADHDDVLATQRLEHAAMIEVDFLCEPLLVCTLLCVVDPWLPRREVRYEEPGDVALIHRHGCRCIAGMVGNTFAWCKEWREV
eukprot:PhM_4_TR604/c0_g1_i1/m.26118